MVNRFVCIACGESKFEYCFYNNHLKKRSKIVKTQIVYAISKLFPTNSRVRFRSQSQGRIARCSTCGLAFLVEVPTETQLESFYSRSYWGNREKSSYAAKAAEAFQTKSFGYRATGQFSFVKDCIVALNSVLEIGAADAQMMCLLRQMNPYLDVHVVEPGSQWESYYELTGFRRVSKFYPFSNDGGVGRYDYIHISHGLEHMAKPTTMFNALRTDLRRNGYLFIEIPNCTESYFKVDLGDMPHLYFYSEPALRLLLSNHGFRIIKLRIFGISWDDYFVLRTARSKYSYDEATENVTNPNGLLLRVLAQRV